MSSLVNSIESSTNHVQRTWFIWPLSRPLTDVHITLVMLPFLWVFGLEQLVPIALIAWAFIKLLLTRKKLIIPATAFIFASFIVWIFISSLSVAAGSDWIVFGRNVVMYLTGLFTLLIIINDTHNGRDITRTITTILILSSIVTLIGVLFMLGFLPGKFEAVLIGNLLPNSIQRSQFVMNNILLREIGRPNAMLGSIRYPRVSSIYLFSNTTALAYIIFIGWTGFSFTTAKRKKKWLLASLLIAQSTVFLLAASRVAIVTLIAAIGCLLLLSIQRKLKLPFLIVPIMVLIFSILVLLIALVPHNFIAEFVNQTFFSLRADSFTSRLEVYKATLDLWLIKPYIGWGTPQKVETVSLAPAGTHGEFLGILFRYGLVGFILYAAIFTTVWVQFIQKLRNAIHLNPINKKVINFHKTIFVIFFALAICALVYGFYFDLSFVILNWVVIGLAHLNLQTLTTWTIRSA